MSEKSEAFDEMASRKVLSWLHTASAKALAEIEYHRAFRKAVQSVCDEGTQKKIDLAMRHTVSQSDD